MDWKSRIDAELPWWRDYLPLLGRLDARRFPSCRALNRLLPNGLVTGSGHPVRFVPEAELPAGPYELRIHATGRVSTRPENWHDLFNALAWARLPAIKAALNALHCREAPVSAAGERGPLRDALTLFDECGAVVASRHPELLNALAQRDWPAAFGGLCAFWGPGTRVIVTGHALLEKFLDPYKAMTANALLIRDTGRRASLEGEDFLVRADAAIARGLLDGEMLDAPSRLSPLPVAGIPGWWPPGGQDAAFYGDRQVFRPPREGFRAAPVFGID